MVALMFSTAMQRCPAIKPSVVMGRKRNPRTLSSRAPQCFLFSFSVCLPSNKSSSVKSCIMNAPCFHLEGSAVRAVWRSSSLLPPPATIYAASPPWAQAPLPPFALLLPSSLRPASVACRLCIPSPARRRQSDQIKSSFAALHSPSARPSVLPPRPPPSFPSIPSLPCALPNDVTHGKLNRLRSQFQIRSWSESRFMERQVRGAPPLPPILACLCAIRREVGNSFLVPHPIFQLR